MDIENEKNTESKQTDEQKEARFEQKSNEVLNKENPKRKERRQASAEELSHPLHGVKLAEILERLVERYGWPYLAKEVNIRCFMYNPNMKSSLGFLRKTKWAREHVEDVYMNMLEEDEAKK